MPISLIVHSGAGDDIHDGLVEPFRRGVIEAAEAGWLVLQNGGSALDAVEMAVRVMEDNPTFDAGRGSFPNQAGEIEMDAILMDGATLNNGAVAAIQRVAHPISVARLVMERTPHTLLVGAGAEAFARSVGVPLVPTEALLVERKDRPPAAGGSGLFLPIQDTVGALALDAEGHLAAATSTGGMRHKMPGRVGDSPIIGCGAYADDSIGAASATGRGEDIMKVILCKSACDTMAGGLVPQQAAESIIHYLAQRVNGRGGIILMNPKGEVGCAYNTLRMGRAWVNPDGEIVAFV
ncbi:MAG: isoaspartyl peptidase/L-asparaginase [Anaerolineae bacterium]|nr:isoaspartyl peptidase/L-asparaginase [Anaerolineae bacterium]